jgi:hypothetical protein
VTDLPDAHQETLRLLARTYEAAERGFPAVEAHLRAHGWEHIGRRYRSPDELERLPICRHCGERYDPDEDDSASLVCFERPVGADAKFPTHEPQEAPETAPPGEQERC